jgi:hypothetical protein
VRCSRRCHSPIDCVGVEETQTLIVQRSFKDLTSLRLEDICFLAMG